MKKKPQMPKYSFRMEADDYNKLKKRAYPESISALIRKVMREFLKSNN